MASRPETIGARIKRLRLATGLSQRELADGLEKCSYAFVSRLEADDRQPSERTVRQLAARFGVTPLEL
ncbi:MAG: helix-turn-helix domain-containing protein [Gaiellaceae bacterium]